MMAQAGSLGHDRTLVTINDPGSSKTQIVLMFILSLSTFFYVLLLSSFLPFILFYVCLLVFLFFLKIGLTVVLAGLECAL